MAIIEELESFKSVLYRCDLCGCSPIIDYSVRNSGYEVLCVHCHTRGAKTMTHRHLYRAVNEWNKRMMIHGSTPVYTKQNEVGRLCAEQLGHVGQ